MTDDKNDRVSARRERRRRERPSLILFVWIIVMWQLLWGELTWANLFGGIAVATLISIFTPMPSVPVSDIDVNWPAMIKLFATFFVDFVVASFTVAWLAIRREDPPPSAAVEIPMRTRDDLTLASAIALINLQPGGLVVDIDNRRQTVIMHLLDGSSTGRIDRTVRQLGRLERQVIKAFENRDLDKSDSAGSLGHDHAVVQDGQEDI
ncbi:Na+/H+ antiporter subunit E [uncultured Corynebacterium sp.]|uniref:Na+/H+ antiporter subunit E n=1 Tax=uncultured Corynebacterium sp. TaxID=159447 RepID=UPI0025F28341|nr:Na+/H+ antiporter subunit E [uncultured Corynebacterium sp.]